VLGEQSFVPFAFYDLPATFRNLNFQTCRRSSILLELKVNVFELDTVPVRTVVCIAPATSAGSGGPKDEPVPCSVQVRLYSTVLYAVLYIQGILHPFGQSRDPSDVTFYLT
jgi:hypothetical protein